MNLNPWGLLVIAVGVVLVIIAVKGTGRQALSAVTGRAAPGAQQTPQGAVIKPA